MSPQDENSQLMFNRRRFLKTTAATGALYWFGPTLMMRGGIAVAQIPGGTLNPAAVPKFQTPLLIPPVMPRAGTIQLNGGKNADYYEISMRQFVQQILPAGLPTTIVWGYGAVTAAKKRGLLLHNAPSLTIEAQWNKPVRIKWINELRSDPLDPASAFLPHLLPVDPTLHWANPPGGTMGRDMRPTFTETPGPYTGPVPIVTHVHGAVGVGDESDGYAEAWYLPGAGSIPADYAGVGTWYGFFADKAMSKFGVAWQPGSATFQYPNDQRATALWYHDHTLGMTRLNVYAGPAGFYIVRGGPAGDGAVLDSLTGLPAVLPGPAPRESDRFPPNKTYREIPLAIQDRSFNSNGSLFYPDNRAFFEGLQPGQLQIPFIGSEACDGEPSDVSPIWNPEFFGNMMMVNGNTWPFLNVEPRRYRLRLLNACNSRTLILKLVDAFGTSVPMWVIGTEGGFLAQPVQVAEQLMMPAERYDVIVDFASFVGQTLTLQNLGPDEPFGGGIPGVDFPVADPASTGRVMEFRVVLPLAEADPTTPPERLVLPAIIPLPAPVRTRQLSLVELESETVKVIEDNGNVVLACDDPDAVAFGPTEARLGSVMNDGGMLMGMGLKWEEPVTENPAVGDTEVWEIYNFTMDAHPIHVHEVAFEVVDRQSVNMETGDLGPVVPRQAWEDGLKDTVIAYPGEITRIKALFATPGQYVWHCHIVEHEDNEMMRPYRIGPEQPGQPMPSMPPMPMAGTETVTTSASSAWRKIRRQRRK